MAYRRGVVGAVALGVALSLGLTACVSGGDEPTDGAARALRVVLAAEPSGLDPQLVQDGNALAIYANISEPLVFRTPEGELEPGLALSWANTGPLTWTFKLREGVTFSNGEPFNADAVVYSLTRILDPDFATQQSGWLGDLAGAEKVDDHTVTITTKQPDPQVPTRLALIMMVPPQAAESESFGSAPIGTGPYKLDSWTRGQKAVLSVNPTYWGDKPTIQKVEFSPVTDAAVRLSALQAGEYDLVPGLLPEQLEQAPRSERTRGLEFPLMVLNTRAGPFKDVRVRQAANHAVDSATLLAKLYNGYGQPAKCQLFGPDVFGHNGSLTDYAYDPAKAKALLAEAGQPNPKVTLIGDATNRWLKDVELTRGVAGYLEEVGFTVDVKLLDFSAYLQELIAENNNATVERADMYFISHGNDTGDGDITYTAFYATTGADSSTSSTEVDNLIAQGRRELDPNKRSAMYQQINKIGCDEAYFLFLMNLENTYGLSENLVFTPRPDGQLLVKTMSWK